MHIYVCNNIHIYVHVHVNVHTCLHNMQLYRHQPHHYCLGRVVGLRYRGVNVFGYITL